MSLAHTQAVERFLQSDLRLQNTTVSAYSARTKAVSVNAGYTIGRSPNYLPPSGIGAFVGSAATASAGVTLRPNSRVRIDQTYYYTRLDAPIAVASLAASPDERVLSNHVSRTRMNLQLTRELSLRAIVDYQSVESNAVLITQPSGRRAACDLLVTYLLNPFTAAYVGYVRQDAGTGSGLLPLVPSPGLRPATLFQQLFVKVSYRVGL